MVSPTILNRFWVQVIKLEENCWLWKGGTVHKYGILNAHNDRVYAHRFSYWIHGGVIPKKMCVCHHCDNPPCVNPEHLFLGTTEDNLRDMVQKNRGALGRCITKVSLRDKIKREDYDAWTKYDRAIYSII